MLKFFLGVLKSNIGAEALRLKKEQWEKGAFMKKLIEQHFRETEKQFDEAQMFGTEASGSFS